MKDLEKRLIVGKYEELRARWAKLIAAVHSGEKLESVEDAMDFLDKDDSARIIYSKRMAEVDRKISLALSDAEDDLKLAEQQIGDLPDGDSPAIKELKRHMLAIDMTKVEYVAPRIGINPDKGGLLPWPSNKPYKSGLDNFLVDPVDRR